MNLRAALKVLACFILPLTLFFTPSAQAWEAHFLLTYAALNNMPEISHKPDISAETLVSFLQKEGGGLVQLLRDNEKWAVQNIPGYAPLPFNLRFIGEAYDNATLEKQFLKSLRVNPDLTFPLYLQFPPGVAHRIHNPLATSAVMMTQLTTEPSIRIANPPLEQINPGEKVSPLEIITSAADEPDYGMDVGVWQDNNTAYGNIYDFGKQPFGNAKVFYSSQAPFHMGFYYESPVLYAAAPFLKKSYAEYRIHTYLALSRYAFDNGHPYWGYRFLGWAIHYTQDLAQPYHATAVPGNSLPKLLIIDLLNILGITTPEQNIIQLMTNRHFALENYEYNLVKASLNSNSSTNVFDQALADEQHDATYPAYNDNYARDVVAKESHAKADAIDAMLKEAFSSRYVTDPKYIFYTTDPQINLLTIVGQTPSPTLEKLNTEIIGILQSIGSHTRNIVRYDIKKN